MHLLLLQYFVYYDPCDVVTADEDMIRKYRESELSRRREQAKLRREKKNREKMFQDAIERAKNEVPVSIINPSGVVVFDTETTGLDPQTDEILQFSACDGEGNVLLNTYIRPIKHG